MARQKITTLFNKNHITITKTETPGSFYKDGNGIYFLRSGGYDPYYYRHQRSHFERVSVVKESPLGFYYTKTEERLRPSVSSLGRNEVNDIGGYRIVVDNITYKISYVKRSGENEVKLKEDGLRPWQVVSGDGAMPEHLITALKDVLDNIITVAEDNKLKYENGKGAKELRKDLYRIFFGSEKGIRFQTDSEKILSHGFDLKTSFRKM